MKGRSGDSRKPGDGGGVGWWEDEGRDEWVRAIQQHSCMSVTTACSLPPRLLRLNPPTVDLNNRAVITLKKLA